MMYRDESVSYLNDAARCTLRSSIIDICFVIAHHAKVTASKIHEDKTKHGAIIILIRYQATFRTRLKSEIFGLHTTAVRSQKDGREFPEIFELISSS